MNCPNCKQPMVLIKLLIHDVWHCRECEKKPKQDTTGVFQGIDIILWSNVLPNSWRTIQECFVDAGNICPFQVEWNCSKIKFEIFTITNRKSATEWQAEDVYGNSGSLTFCTLAEWRLKR